METCPKPTGYHQDILKEIVNIGVGRAAGILNRMSRTHIMLNVPQLSFFSVEEIDALEEELFDQQVSSIHLAFDGGFSGGAALLFSPESASSLVSIIINEEEIPFDEDSLRIGTLQEVGNIVLNGVMGSITNFMKTHVRYYPPEYREGNFRQIFSFEDEKQMILFIRTQFSLKGTLITGDIIILFRMASFIELFRVIDRIVTEEIQDETGQKNGEPDGPRR